MLLEDPSDKSFKFDLDANLEHAKLALELDSYLKSVRHKWVPSRYDFLKNCDPKFWFENLWFWSFFICNRNSLF